MTGDFVPRYMQYGEVSDDPIADRVAIEYRISPEELCEATKVELIRVVAGLCIRSAELSDEPASELDIVTLIRRYGALSAGELVGMTARESSLAIPSVLHLLEEAGVIEVVDSPESLRRFAPVERDS